MRNGLLVALQLAGLWLLNEAGYLLVKWLHLPVPGNVMGMLLLFALLITGIIRLEWIERASSFLIRHLAFFFIPVAVGLMEFGGMFVRNGAPILGAIIGSIVIGMLVTGGVSQALEKRKEKETHGRVRNAV